MHQMTCKSFRERYPEVPLDRLDLTREDPWAFLSGNDDSVEEQDLEDLKQQVLSLKALDNLAASVYGNGGEEAEEPSLERADGEEPRSRLVDGLRACGLHSAHQIGSMTEGTFLRRYQEKLGLSREEGLRLYRTADMVRRRAAHLYLSLKTTAGSPHLTAMRASCMGETGTRFFRNMPSYQDIFGALSWEVYAAGQTVLDPAAYFYDLMRIVDKYVTNVFFPKTSPYSLPSRRPDLGELTLTAENANTEMPYTEVVSRRLKDALKRLLPENTDLEKHLAKQVYPQSLPFCAPMERVRLWEKQRGVEEVCLAELWQCPAAELVRTRLNWSESMLSELSAPLGNRLKDYCGLTELDSDTMEKLSSAKALCRVLGLDEGELDALFRQELYDDEYQKGLSMAFFINTPVKGETSGGWLNLTPKGKVEHLTVEGLDRLVRFVRLSRAGGLSFSVLDWCLAVLSPDGIHRLDRPAVEGVVSLLRQGERCGLSIGDMLTLVGPYKPCGADSQYSAVFGGADLPERWLPSKDTSTTGRLAACLKVDSTGLEALAALTFGPVETVTLSRENLWGLYRHACMAGILGLTPEEYVVWARICGAEGAAAFQAPLIGRLLLYRLSEDLSAYTLRYIMTGESCQYISKSFTQDALKRFLRNLELSAPPKEPDERKEFLLGELSAFLNVDQERLAAVTGFAPPAPAELALEDWSGAFLPDGHLDEKQAAARLTYAGNVLEAFDRWLSLSGPVPLPLLRAVGEHPARFGLSPGRTPEVEALGCILDAARLSSRLGGRYEAALECLDKAEHISGSLAEALWLDGEEAQQLWSQGGGSSPAGQLAYFFRRLEAVSRLGVSARRVKELLSCRELSFEEQKGLADSLELSGGVEGLGNRTRDALVSALLRELNRTYVDLETPDDLYKYLLLDVSMGERMKTSPIREGINAVQLYLQRCRMGMEQGVGQLDIPETWWSWLLSYRQWEANRRMFIYPENYLLPETRRTKSKLFQEAESALQQGLIEDGRIEEIYVKYLDGYDALAQLSPCAAYAADIDAQNVLYLLGRTKEEPYTYYICHQVDKQAWTEWEEIGVKIPSQFVTPVYVFGRLYLLWVEQKTAEKPLISMDEDEKIRSSGRIARKIDLKYTVQNLLGEWGAPQTLLRDEIVCYEDENGIPVGKAFAAAYQTDRECWNRVTALRLTSRNFEDSGAAAFLDKGQEYEQLFVMVGAFPYNFSETIQDYFPLDDIDSDPDKRAFADRMARTINHLNIMNDQNQSGRVLAGITRIFNQDMEEEYLMGANEFILFDEYVPLGRDVVPIPLRDQVTNAVGVLFSRDTFRSTLMPTEGLLPPEAPVPDDAGDVRVPVSTESLRSYTLYAPKDEVVNRVLDYLMDGGVVEDHKMTQKNLMRMNLYEDTKEDFCEKKFLVRPSQFVDIQAMLLSALGSARLFQSNGRVRILPVANQPGAFIYECPDETFLLLPDGKKPVFTKLDSGVTVSLPKITYLDFLETFGVETSGNIIWALGEGKERLINRNGFPYYDTCTLERVQAALGLKVSNGESVGLSKDEVLNIYSTIHDRPVATSRMFEGKGINQEESEQIFYILTGLESETSGKFLTSRVRFEVERLRTPNSALPGYVGKKAPEELSRLFLDYLQSAFAVSLHYSSRGNFDSDLPMRPSPNGTGGLRYQVLRLTNCAIKKLKHKMNQGGVRQFLSLKTQSVPVMPAMPFERLGPNPEHLIYPKAMDGTQVDFEGLYQNYNWELFYHLPMAIAELLQNSGRHELARKWMEYIYNPSRQEELIDFHTFQRHAARSYFTDGESKGAVEQLSSANVLLPVEEGAWRVCYEFDGILSADTEQKLKNIFTGSKEQQEEKVLVVKNILRNLALSSGSSFYWNFFPFRNQRLDSVLEDLREGSDAMIAYANDPYNPHAVAELRIGAYEKYTVMSYIQNLISWGDDEFSRYTWESLNTATMLYVLAADLLGPRPTLHTRHEKPVSASFNDIQRHYQKGELPQFLLYLESLLPGPTGDGGETAQALSDAPDEEVGIYFKVPENRDIAGLWDLVDDRLYKIRNALNIQGQREDLSLYGNPVDPRNPALAGAASNNAPKPGGRVSGLWNHYRFTYLIEQAKSLANLLIQLGASLLAAQERYDGEQLQMLMQTQERALMDLSTSIKSAHITELEQVKSGLEASFQNAQYRSTHFRTLSEEFMNAGEIASMVFQAAGTAALGSSAVLKMSAGVTRLIPEVGSPFAMTYGGRETGSSLDNIAGSIELTGMVLQSLASAAGSMAGYQRRREDWEFQRALAEYDIKSLSAQLRSVDAQLEGARRDLEVHQTAIRQRDELIAFYQKKVSSVQLYQWMTGRLKGTLLQTYQLALELGVRAELAYQQELNSDRTFLNYLYWDGQKNGLLAGEGLLLSLNQMQSAYHAENSRTLEIEKHISLARECPGALFRLKSTGMCCFSLTEAMYDFDYPGHYLRRIQMVSVSIPALLGPYQTLKATLTQDRNVILKRPNSSAALDYMFFWHEKPENPPAGVETDLRRGQRIAISKGIDDSGMFSGGGQDERYLPFEGTGAVSSWTLEMPKEMNRFDFSTISDVIITVKYTALEDSTHRAAVLKCLAGREPGYYGSCFSLKNFSREWEAFLADDKAVKSLRFPVERFPFCNGEPPSVSFAALRLDVGLELPQKSVFLALTAAGTSKAVPVPMEGSIGVQAVGAYGALPCSKALGDWQLTLDMAAVRSDPKLKMLLKGDRLDPEVFKNIEIVIVCERRINQ